MVAYLVLVNCDEEYGCRDVEKIFDSYEKAEAFINKKIEENPEDEFFYPWYNENGVPKRIIEEQEIE
jgi:hypothetical protein